MLRHIITIIQWSTHGDDVNAQMLRVTAECERLGQDK